MKRVTEERGAALLTVLLFMVLTFIVVTAMLGALANEMVTSGLHRDGIRALEHAQAGLEEGVRRLEAGRPYLQFAGSLAPGIGVSVVPRVSGTSGSILEIQSDATVQRARRSLSEIVQFAIMWGLPDVWLGEGLSQKASGGDIASGQAYSQTYLRYQVLPTANDLAYAGWRIGKCNNPDAGCNINAGDIPPCYTHKECVDRSYDPALKITDAERDRVRKWHAGQRRTVSPTSDPSTYSDIVAQTNKCPVGGGGTLPSDLVPLGAIAADGTNISGQPLYGLDSDDQIWQRNADGTWTIFTLPEPQAVTALLPCGLPYKWVSDSFDSEDNDNPPTPDKVRWFKTIAFDQWLDNYWILQPDFTRVRRDGSSCPVDGDGNPLPPCLPSGNQPSLVTYPEFGAIPAFPNVAILKSNWQRCVAQTSISECEYRSSGTVSGGDFGSCADPPLCTSGGSKIVLFETGNWSLTGMDGGHGHGFLIVDGDLRISGNVKYYGVIIANGEVEIGAGDVEIWGGLISKSASKITGSLVIHAGVSVQNFPLGPGKVTRLTWWER